MSAVPYSKQFVIEILTAAAEEIYFQFEKTIIEYEGEIDRQRRLLDVVWKPQVALHRIELPQQDVCEDEEEVLDDQQHLWVQESNSSLDQEDPEPPQIKEEQEEVCTRGEVEQLVLKQELDTFMLTPTHGDGDHSRDQTLNSGVDETRNAVEEKALSFVSVKSSVVPEANRDQQLLFHNSDEAESSDQKGGKLGDSASMNAELKRNEHQESNSVYNPTMSTNHCNSHTGKNPFKCDLCEKMFKCKQYLQRHLVTHTDEKSYSCQTCGKGFRLNCQLIGHMRIHTGEKPYSCKTCGKDFRLNCQLIGHMRVHTGEKPYSCKTCGKDFRCSGNLICHMRTHTGEKPYLCKTCGRRFGAISALQNHIRIHTDEKPYTCEICGKDFRSSSNMTVHRRTHTGEKPYLCTTCGTRFCTMAVLKRHMIIHTGEKVFPCGTCGEAFRHGDHLISHMRTHTGDEPDLRDKIQ